MPIGSIDGRTTRRGKAKKVARGLHHGTYLGLQTIIAFVLGGTFLFAQEERSKSFSFSLMDAAEAGVLHNPALRLQQAQINIARATKLQFSSQFHTVLAGSIVQQHATLPLTAAQVKSLNLQSQVSDATSYTTGFTKLFRSGISVGPQLSLTRSTDNVQRRLGVNNSQANFEVTIPLLQGRGERVVAAGERAANYEVEAALFDLNHDLSAVLTNTANDYWSFVAASENLKVALSSKQRGQALLDNTRALIDADQLPASNLDNAAANLADRNAACIVAEAALMNAWQALIITIGVDPSDFPDPPMPQDTFPDGLSQPPPPADIDSVRFWVETAIARGADIMAGVKREEEQRQLGISALDQFRPILSLSVTSGYTGLHEGRLLSEYFLPVAGFRGPSVTAGLTYQLPTKDSARAQLMKTDASLHQAQIRTAELRRNANASVIVGLTNIRSAILRLHEVEESVRSLQRALESEREKFRLGSGSILDVLQVEDRLNTALQNRVQAQLAYATNLTNFRFVTGTLVPADRYAPHVDRSVFFQLPDRNQVIQAIP